MSNTTELIYLIENAEQGSPLEQIESGRAARVELNTLTSRIAALEAQNKELVEALTSILTCVSVRIDDPRIHIFDNARALLSEVAQ